MYISEADLILTADGRIYHLNSLPEELAPTVILVGDPNRVEKVSKHFDKIEVRQQNREMITHSGWIGKHHLTVISTGMSTDNIDIVLTELDALVNVDLKTRRIKDKLTSLTFIRIGTSGALQAETEVDSVLLSARAIGFDNLLEYYRASAAPLDQPVEDALADFFAEERLHPYVASADKELLAHYAPYVDGAGMTATCSGFYAPQGRRVRLVPRFTGLLDRLRAFRYQNERVTNFEMETSGIYGLSQLMGHRALSVNVIVANRAQGTFSSNYAATMDKTIEMVLEHLPEPVPYPQ
ncbi:MAG: phosphorylase [Gammaproteobacteria bacterium]|jgi:uridine phosphorylase|nr:phosphorylase [Gammaproteobacteria bacterium]